MSMLKNSDIKKMNEKEINEKINELKIERIRSKIRSHKSMGKTKEIKKALARLLTFTNGRKNSQKHTK